MGQRVFRVEIESCFHAISQYIIVTLSLFPLTTENPHPSLSPLQLYLRPERSRIRVALSCR